MSQSFKLKYDQMRESDPTNPDGSQNQKLDVYEQFYPEQSSSRNLCFVWLDGRRMFFNYSFMVSVEYEPTESFLKVAFSSRTLILKGVNLEKLFYDLMQQLPRQITCTHPRYNVIEGDNFMVNEISVQE